MVRNASKNIQKPHGEKISFSYLIIRIFPLLLEMGRVGLVVMNPYICSQDAEFAGDGNHSWRRENLGVP